MDWSSVASEASGVLSTAMNWIASSQENKKQRNYERRMTEYAYNKDLEMWERENEYNSPTNQMLRLQQAGLNPMLMVDKATPGNSTHIPSMGVPGGEFRTPQKDFAIDFQNIRMNALQLDRIQKMNELLDQQIDAQFWDTMRKNFDFGLDYGEPGTVNLVKSRSGRDYSYSNPNYQSADGGTFGPRKFYDLSATAADASSSWHRNTMNQQMAIKYKNTNTLFEWERRTAEAEAKIKEATARWLDQREKDWQEKGMFADKMAGIDWFTMQMADMSKKGALTIGGLQRLLDMARGLKKF